MSLSVCGFSVFHLYQTDISRSDIFYTIQLVVDVSPVKICGILSGSLMVLWVGRQDLGYKVH